MRIQNILQTLHLSLINIDYCNIRNWNFRKVISPFARIYLVKDGEGYVIFNNNKFELKPGKIFLIPSFTLCNYSSDLFLEHYYIHCIPQVAGAGNVFSFLDFAYEVSAIDDDERLMKRILELNPGRKLLQINPSKYSKANLQPKEEMLDSSLKISAYIETQGILLQLFSRFIQHDHQKAGIRNFNPDKQINKAVDHIHQNLAKPLLIGDLAEICHLSDDYFSRLFLKIMGTRPVEYINRKRIESAQLLLITSDDLIEKIALDSGFDNYSYFNRVFKNIHVLPPANIEDYINWFECQ